MTATVVSTLIIAGCNGKKEPAIPQTISYHGDFSELNAQASPGAIIGRAGVTIVGDSLTFSVTARGFEPGSMHMMHIHAFKDSAEAVCASGEQDANGDDLVDLIETRAVSGITMIPFHDNPVSLAIEADTYPVAAEDSIITYQKTVSLSAMESAIAAAYGVGSWVFEHGVVYIHGADPRMELPETVQSLPDAPARATLPIACAELSVP
jgi:hypothetical protein